jgi:uncharacterized protein YaeQ
MALNATIYKAELQVSDMDRHYYATHALTLAQQWDLTADEVARNVFAHPTLSEAMKEAVEGIAGHMINL